MLWNTNKGKLHTKLKYGAKYGLNYWLGKLILSYLA